MTSDGRGRQQERDTGEEDDGAVVRVGGGNDGAGGVEEAATA